MSNNSENNKRIAKNTAMLYVRMLLLMAVNLYLSRIILQVLGVIDFGIYNVVGGVIAMLGFVQSSLSAASSRFITYDIGAGDMNLAKKTYGNIVAIHLLMAALLFVLAETVGLWFVMEKMHFPADRYHAAIWVYQFSVLTALVMVVSVPYNAAIIAHEKMTAFAYFSIFEALLRFGCALLLLVVSFDKLIAYASFMFIIQCLVRIVYNFYCTKHFEETKVRPCYDKIMFKKIFSFAGWTMNGSLAVMGYTQGLNILLNLFFGPAVNAARGIAVQVQSVTQQFCTNFQMALNPQLTKSYAQGNFDYMHILLIKSSKFSFYILFIMALPLMLEAETVLHWWLGIVPDHTVNFLRLILCTSLVNTLANPIIISVHATGKLMKFQMIEGTMLLSIVPIAYLLLKFFNIPPETVFIVHLFIGICTQYARLRIVLPMIGMRLKPYFIQVILPICAVIIMSPIAPYLVYANMEQTELSFWVICIVCVISCLPIIYSLGCTDSERSYIKDKANAVISKFRLV